MKLVNIIISVFIFTCTTAIRVPPSWDFVSEKQTNNNRHVVSHKLNRLPGNIIRIRYPQKQAPPVVLQPYGAISNIPQLLAVRKYNKYREHLRNHVQPKTPYPRPIVHRQQSRVEGTAKQLVQPNIHYPQRLPHFQQNEDKENSGTEVQQETQYSQPLVHQEGNGWVPVAHNNDYYKVMEDASPVEQTNEENTKESGENESDLENVSDEENTSDSENRIETEDEQSSDNLGTSAPSAENSDGKPIYLFDSNFNLIAQNSFNHFGDQFSHLPRPNSVNDEKPALLQNPRPALLQNHRPALLQNHRPALLQNHRPALLKNHRDDKTHEPNNDAEESRDDEEPPEVERDEEEKAPISDHENPVTPPTRPIYPGEGKWAQRGLTHRPFISNHKYTTLEEDEENPEGHEIFDHAGRIFHRQGAKLGGALTVFPEKHKLGEYIQPVEEKKNDDNGGEENEELNEEDDEDEDEDFVPTQIYSQVRKTEDEEHLPPIYEGPAKLREVIKDSKIQTVYTEEGYEDIAYDHAGHEKQASENEGFAEAEEEIRKEKFKKAPKPVIRLELPDDSAIEESNYDNSKLVASDESRENDVSDRTRPKITIPAHRTRPKLTQPVSSESTRSEQTRPKITKPVRMNINNFMKTKELKTTSVKDKQNGDREMEILSEIKILSTPNNGTMAHKYVKIFPKVHRYEKLSLDSGKSKLQDASKTKQVPNDPRSNLTAIKIEELSTTIQPADTSTVTDDNIPTLSSTTSALLKPLLGKNDKSTNVEETKGKITNTKQIIDAVAPEKDKKLLRKKRFTNDFPNIEVDIDFIDKIRHVLPDVKVDLTHVKYPYYYMKDVDKNSALKYAENLKNAPEKKYGELSFYEQAASRVPCEEVETDVDPIPERVKDAEENAEEMKESDDVAELAESPRLRGLGDKIRCFKKRYFGENPLDSPFFKEELVEAVTPPFTTFFNHKSEESLPNIYEGLKVNKVDLKGSVQQHNSLENAPHVVEESRDVASHEVPVEENEINTDDPAKILEENLADLNNIPDEPAVIREIPRAAGNVRLAVGKHNLMLEQPNKNPEGARIGSLIENLQKSNIFEQPASDRMKIAESYPDRGRYDGKSNHVLRKETEYKTPILHAVLNSRPIKPHNTNTNLQTPPELSSTTSPIKTFTTLNPDAEVVNIEELPVPTTTPVLNIITTPKYTIDLKPKHIYDQIELLHYLPNQNESENIDKSDQNKFTNSELSKSVTLNQTLAIEEDEEQAKVYNIDNISPSINSSDIVRATIVEDVVNVGGDNYSTVANNSSNLADHPSREPRFHMPEEDNKSKNNSATGNKTEEIPESLPLRGRRRKFQKKRPQFHIFDVSRFVPTLPTYPFFMKPNMKPKTTTVRQETVTVPSRTTTDHPKAKTRSEVYYKDEIKPSEQLNVFIDVLRNIRNSSAQDPLLVAETQDSRTQVDGFRSRIRVPTRHTYSDTASSANYPVGSVYQNGLQNFEKSNTLFVTPTALLPQLVTHNIHATRSRNRQSEGNKGVLTKLRDEEKIRLESEEDEEIDFYTKLDTQKVNSSQNFTDSSPTTTQRTTKAPYRNHRESSVKLDGNSDHIQQAVTDVLGLVPPAKNKYRTIYKPKVPAKTSTSIYPGLSEDVLNKQTSPKRHPDELLNKHRNQHKSTNVINNPNINQQESAEDFITPHTYNNQPLGEVTNHKNFQNKLYDFPDNHKPEETSSEDINTTNFYKQKPEESFIQPQNYQNHDDVTNYRHKSHPNEPDEFLNKLKHQYKYSEDIGNAVIYQKKPTTDIGQTPNFQSKPSVEVTSHRIKNHQHKTGEFPNQHTSQHKYADDSNNPNIYQQKATEAILQPHSYQNQPSGRVRNQQHKNHRNTPASDFVGNYPHPSHQNNLSSDHTVSDYQYKNHQNLPSRNVANIHKNQQKPITDAGTYRRQQKPRNNIIKRYKYDQSSEDKITKYVQQQTLPQHEIPVYPPLGDVPSQTLNKFYVQGMRPPPQRQTLPEYTLPPSKQHRRNYRHHVSKRHAAKPAYTEVVRSRGPQFEKVNTTQDAKDDADDDYIPHRPKNYHYDVKTGRIVYDDAEKSVGEEEEPVEYAEIYEQVSQTPQMAVSTSTISWVATAKTDKNEPSLLHYIDVLKSDPNYKLIPDPTTTEKGDASTTEKIEVSTSSPLSTTPPAFLALLEKVKNDSHYTLIPDETTVKPKPTTTTTTEDSYGSEEVIEESKLESVENSPANLQPQTLTDIQIFDISEFLPKRNNFQQKSSIDYSKYKTIERPQATTRHTLSSRYNAENEKQLQEVNTKKVPIIHSKESDNDESQHVSESRVEEKTSEDSLAKEVLSASTTSASVRTVRRRVAVRVSSTSSPASTSSTFSSVAPESESTSTSTASAITDSPLVSSTISTTILTTSAATTTTSPITKPKRIRIRPKNRSTTAKSTSTLESTPKTSDSVTSTTETSDNDSQNDTEKPPEKKRPARIKIRTSTERFFENDDSDNTTKVVRRRHHPKTTHFTTDILDAPPLSLAPIIVPDIIFNEEAEETDKDTKKSVQAVPQARSIDNSPRRLLISIPSETKASDIEVFKEYNTKAKHGGNYKKASESQEIKVTETPRRRRPVGQRRKPVEANEAQSKITSAEVLKTYDSRKKHGGNYKEEDELSFVENPLQSETGTPNKQNARIIDTQDTSSKNIDVEIIKDYDHKKKHGGNYKKQIYEVDSETLPGTEVLNRKSEQIQETHRIPTRNVDVGIIKNYDQNKRHGGNYRKQAAEDSTDLSEELWNKKSEENYDSEDIPTRNIHVEVDKSYDSTGKLGASNRKEEDKTSVDIFSNSGLGEKSQRIVDSQRTLAENVDVDTEVAAALGILAKVNERIADTGKKIPLRNTNVDVINDYDAKKKHGGNYRKAVEFEGTGVRPGLEVISKKSDRILHMQQASVRNPVAEGTRTYYSELSDGENQRKGIDTSTTDETIQRRPISRGRLISRRRNQSDNNKERTSAEDVNAVRIFWTTTENLKTLTTETPLTYNTGSEEVFAKQVQTDEATQAATTRSPIRIRGRSRGRINTRPLQQHISADAIINQSKNENVEVPTGYDAHARKGGNYINTDPGVAQQVQQPILTAKDEKAVKTSTDDKPLSNKKDSEVFKAYDKEKKHGGNYKKLQEAEISHNPVTENSNIVTKNPQKVTQKLTDVVPKPFTFYTDPKLPDNVNKLKESTLPDSVMDQIAEEVSSEGDVPKEEDYDQFIIRFESIEDATTTTTSTTAATTPKKPMIIKDPSKRLYFYATV